MAAKFEISKDKAGKSRFHLKAANGEIIAASRGYDTTAGGFRRVTPAVTKTMRTIDSEL